MESSAHVKQQLKSLGAEVLQAQKTYNSVRTERQQREEQLKRLQDTYVFLSIGEKGVQSSGRLASLEEKLRKAEIQLERETATTETYEYMIADRRKQRTLSVQPTVPMKQKLQAVMTLNEGHLEHLTKAGLEMQTLRGTVKGLQRGFLKQKSRHSDLLEALLEQHAYCREFEELSAGHRSQQKLRTRLFIKESTIERLNFSLAVSTTHESKQLEIAEHQSALDRMEVTIDTMTKAAKTDSPNGILDYWNFLKESEEYLKSTAAALEDRMTEAKQQLEGEKSHFQREFEALTSHGRVPTALTALEEQQRVATQTLEGRQAKVRQ